MRIRHATIGLPRALLASVLCIVACGNRAQAQLTNETGVFGEGVIEILNEVSSARKELTSWALRAKVLVKHRKFDEEAESHLVSVCDNSTARFRHETRGYIHTSLSSSAAALSAPPTKESLAPMRLHKLVSFVAQTREHMIEWNGIGEPQGGAGASATSHIELRDLGTPPMYLTGASSAFNPQAAGLFDSTSPHRMETVEGILRRFAQNASSVQLRIDNNSHLKVSFDYGAWARRSVYIDRVNGFTVTRSTYVGLNDDGSEKDYPRSESNAEWQFQSGCWVPTNFSWARLENDTVASGTRYSITWEEINPKVLADELFDYHSFPDFWPGLNLVERRNDQLLVLESPFLGDVVAGNGAAAESRPRMIEADRRNTYLVLLANVLFVLIVCALIYVRSKYTNRI